MDLSIVGNIAKREKGRASASAKPNIPIAGETKLEVAAASTSNVPIIGPVHEKETRARVNAMKKIERYPVVLSTLESILFDQEAGSVSSNPPMNDTANTTRRMKNAMLKPALVASSLSAEAPNIIVTSSPSRTYMTMMEIP